MERASCLHTPAWKPQARAQLLLVLPPAQPAGAHNSGELMPFRSTAVNPATQSQENISLKDKYQSAAPMRPTVAARPRSSLSQRLARLKEWVSVPRMEGRLMMSRNAMTAPGENSRSGQGQLKTHSNVWTDEEWTPA